jgi:DNA-binding phage protein
MTSQPITLQIHLVMDEQGKLTAAIPAEEGEKVVIDRAAVKASSRTCVKKSEGEVLAKRIKDSMDEHNLTIKDVAEKVKIGRPTLYAYLRAPGKAPLDTLLRICRATGIQQITLQTGGNYL